MTRRPLISLTYNESPYGCSPRALAAAQARLMEANRYPDPASHELRQAIGRSFGIDPERIVCGNGSEELLDIIGRRFARPGDQIMMSQSGFFQFARVAERVGANLVRTPEIDFHTDIAALLARITPRTRLIYLATPNNPTGVCLANHELIRLHRSLPGEIVMVLDLAYGEFMPATVLAELMAYATTQENLVLTRTFSKAYGLAALRVGWLYAPRSMIPGLNLLRGIGNINAVAQAAALAALADPDFVARIVAETAAERAFLAAGLTRLGLEFVSGSGNFLLTRFPDQQGLRAAEFLPFAMEHASIWLRPVTEPGFDNWTRIGLGLRDQNQLLIDSLATFLDGHNTRL